MWPHPLINYCSSHEVLLFSDAERFSDIVLFEFYSPLEPFFSDLALVDLCLLHSPNFMSAILPSYIFWGPSPLPPTNRAALNSLQNIITNFRTWRHDVIRVFVLFILRDIPDSCPLVLDSALKMLVKLLSHWKSLITSEEAKQVSSNWSLGS